MPADDTQLKEAQWRLQQLQTQYDYLVSKSSSQAQAYKSAEEDKEVGGSIDATHICRLLQMYLHRLSLKKFEI